MTEKQAMAAAFVRPVEAVFTAGFPLKLDLRSDMLVVVKDRLKIIEKHVLPFFSVAENDALYTKMKGDKYGFLAMLKEEDRQPLIDSALAAIEVQCPLPDCSLLSSHNMHDLIPWVVQAASKAAESLPPAHPPRLALLFTKTAFYHDVMEWPERAIALGKRALEEAAPELVLLDEESYRDSAEIVRLIEENMKLWSDPKGKVFAGVSADPENTFKVSLGTAPKGSPPPPVVPDSVPAVAPISFKNPGDWGYEVHEGPSLSEMRSRKKAARRGLMG
ncbi:14-3-3-like protein GF14 omicron isoform X1 [Setaria viridis]|uniref:14-3-3-like protein GF14 omicron isoform X1 n=1 Tax=Setaria viridis TaxID=4556 RepID=UPI0014938059|nr:14-3-3-like protein GF14 omicron isoform X2 [Setaria viridis]